MEQQVAGQSALADKIEEQAIWREVKAEEYPDDPRNARAAECLHQLAAYVRSLPADDARIQYLAAISVGDDVFAPSSNALGRDPSLLYDFIDEENSFWRELAFHESLVAPDALDAIVGFYREQGCGGLYIVPPPRDA